MAHLIETIAADAEARRVQLVRELAPVGLLQTFLVEQLALGMGRLRRVDAAEDPGDRAWVRDHAQAQRSFYRSLAEFRRQVKADARALGAEAPPSTAPPETVEAAGRRSGPDGGAQTLGGPSPAGVGVGKIAPDPGPLAPTPLAAVAPGRAESPDLMPGMSQEFRNRA